MIEKIDAWWAFLVIFSIHTIKNFLYKLPGITKQTHLEKVYLEKLQNRG